MRGTVTRHTFQRRRDAATGKEVCQLTSEPGNHHHLYFTSNSFNKDSSQIVFISDGWEDQPNLFKMELSNGEATQLTAYRDGYLKSYVYYDGNPYRGLGKASPSFNPVTNQLLYIHGNDVRLLDVGSLEDRVIYTLPDQVMTGFTHLSTDGRYACVPYITAEAFNVEPGGEFNKIRDKVAAERIESQMLVIDTAAGTGEVWYSQVGWITHVQFHPSDHRKILYNHEGGRVQQRIWLYDHGKIMKIRDESVEHEPIWVCHEMWQREGKTVIYHGTKRRLTPQSYNFVGKVDPSTGETIELGFAPEHKPYGHFTVSMNQELLVTDGIIDNVSIHLCRAAWQTKELSWEKLCEHNSSFSTQDVHPHPIFSHDDKRILFTSDVHNERTRGHIYVVQL